MPRKTPSQWADTLINWLDDNNFSLRTTPRSPTWKGTKDTDIPSVLDLAFANDAVTLSAQMSDVDISFADLLSSDHAALIFHIYPSDSIALLPPPAPKGYRLDNNQHDAWIKSFRRQMPFGPVSDSLSMGDCLPDREELAHVSEDTLIQLPVLDSGGGPDPVSPQV